MTSAVLVPDKSLIDLVPKSKRHTCGWVPLRGGAELQYVILPYETDYYAVLTKYEREQTQTYVVSKTQFDAVAAERSPLSEGEYLKAFAEKPRSFDNPATPGTPLTGDAARKVAEKETQGHKPEDENSLQTKEEASLTFADSQIIKDIQGMFSANSAAKIAELGVSKLVSDVKLPNGKLLLLTAYMVVGDTLVPEVHIFEDDRIIICTRKVDAEINKEFMRENVARSTKIAAGIGLSTGGSTIGLQPKEGDPAFARGKPMTATANGPGISFSGEMVKTYHRLTIKASLRMVLKVGEYEIKIVPRKAP